MKREFLETINSILEFVQGLEFGDEADAAVLFDLHQSLTEDGFGYPEKSLTRLQEEVTDLLSQNPE